MNSLEALKRIRQETAPNTYNKDFNKDECCNVIENDLRLIAWALALQKQLDNLEYTIKELKELIK